MKLPNSPVSAKWAVLVLFASPLFAAKVQTFAMTKDTLKNVAAACAAVGDQFLPPGVNGVFGCIKANGNSAFCGGVGSFSKTCTTTTQRVVVKKGQTPTQADVQATARSVSTNNRPTNAQSVEQFLKP